MSLPGPAAQALVDHEREQVRQTLRHGNQETLRDGIDGDGSHEHVLRDLVDPIDLVHVLVPVEMPARRSKRASPNPSKSHRIIARVACPRTCPKVSSPSALVGIDLRYRLMSGLLAAPSPSPVPGSTTSHPASSQPWNTTASPMYRTDGARRHSPSSAR